MRLVEMRDWMNGQSWVDMTEHRVNPPAGMPSHWSRLLELPMAVEIGALSTVVDRGVAERIVVAVWPCVLLAALVLTVLCLARRLFAPASLIAAAAMVALNPLLQFQLLPGRIDHHGMQMLLTLLLAFAAIRAIVDRRQTAALAAGVLGGLMLAIGLETAPLVVVAAALFGAAWIVDGERLRRVVATFGASFAVATPLFFIATVPPSRWDVVASDALSPPWLLHGRGRRCGARRARVRAGGETGPAARSSRSLRAPPSRVSSSGSGRMSSRARLPTSTRSSGCCGSRALARRNRFPFSSRRIQEASSISLSSRWSAGWALASPRYARAGRGPTCLLLFAFATMGLALALGQMRGASFASLFAFFGWLYPADRALASFGQDRNPARKLVSVSALTVIIVGSLPFLWSALGTGAGAGASESASLPGCGARDDMAALAAEPRGLVLAPLRLGPRILVATDHDVVAAPYHRNNPGNRFALDTLTAVPDVARAPHQSARRALRRALPRRYRPPAPHRIPRRLAS